MRDADHYHFAREHHIPNFASTAVKLVIGLYLFVYPHGLANFWALIQGKPKKAGVMLHPIQDNHIVQVSQNETFTTPRDGHFLSSEYLKRILDAQAEEGLAILWALVQGKSKKVSVKLHPIQDNDIIQVSQDETFTAPRDGYFLSSEYLKRILDAQVEKGW